MSDPVTPSDLSKELGVDARRIREYLRRKNQGTLTPAVTRWYLTKPQADEVRAHFRGVK
jgi:hypothetical protein